MSRIGKVVPVLGREELRRRIIVTLDRSNLTNPFDHNKLWNGAPVSKTGWFSRVLHCLFAANRLSGEVKSFKGIRDAIERYYYTRPDLNIHQGVDVAEVGMPFPHLAICSGNAPSSTLTEPNLCDAFRESFGSFSEEPRTRFYLVPSMAEKDLCIHFGFGVFVPDANESPIGRLQIAPFDPDEPAKVPEESAWKEPKLPGLSAHRPAAFYRDQLGVAFAATPRLAPASIQGVIPSDYIFFFGRMKPSDPMQLSFLHANEARGDPAPGKNKNYTIQDISMEEGKAIAVYEDNQTAPKFWLRWIGDRGEFALKHKPPKVPYLEFAGIMLPRCGIVEGIKDWWVDLDQDGILSTSPLIPRAFALANSYTGMRLYDRALMKDAKPSMSVDINHKRVFSLVPLHLGPQLSWSYRLSSTKPMGYIALPPGPQLQVVPYPLDDPDVLPLHWMNNCGGIRQYWSWFDTRGIALGLSEWSLGATAGVVIDRSIPGKLLIKSDEAGRIARLNLDRIESVDPENELQVHPGDGFIIGCHHFIYREGFNQ